MLTLTITAPDAPTRTIELHDDVLALDGVVIGRAMGCGIRLDDPMVSRSHARLARSGGKLTIADHGSTSGTKVGERKIEKEVPVEIGDGQTITIGPFTMTAKVSSMPADVLDSTVMPGLSPAAYMPAMTAGTRVWSGGELRVRVARINDETADVRTFLFAAQEPTRFAYKPGQFMTLHLTIDGKSVPRSYTISTTPSRPDLIGVTVKRAAAAGGHPPGVVSNWLHDHLKEGDALSISGAFGEFSCHSHPHPRLLLVSAGSGITPMLSMTRWLTDTAAAVDIVFAHSARSPDDLIARAELEALARINPRLRLLFTVSRPEPRSAWSGNVGRLDLALLKAQVPELRSYRVFVCGPDGFMSGMKKQLATDGFPMDQHHEESFGGPAAAPAAPAVTPQIASGDKTPASGVRAVASTPFGLKAIIRGLTGRGGGDATPAQPTPTVAAPVQAIPSVVLSKSGKTIPVPEGSSILAAATAAGITLPFGCRMGVCGACKQVLRSGEIHKDGYQDSILSAADRSAGCILICIAKPKGKVELDA